MCLRSVIEIFLITFIVRLWWSWSNRLRSVFLFLYNIWFQKYISLPFLILSRTQTLFPPFHKRPSFCQHCSHSVFLTHTHTVSCSLLPSDSFEHEDQHRRVMFYCSAAQELNSRCSVLSRKHKKQWNRHSPARTNSVLRCKHKEECNLIVHGSENVVIYVKWDSRKSSCNLSSISGL